MNKIPKIIHYCWFGPNPLPEIFKKCYDSWIKYCPDYKIKFWNENNFDFKDNEYLEKTYELGKFAHFSDYARLKIINENGGIYFDTDVEVIRNFDEMLIYNGFFGFDSDNFIATGLGFGSIKNNGILTTLMNKYASFSNQIDDKFVFQTCPVLDSKTLSEYGLKLNNKIQIINNNIFLSKDFLNPADLVDSKLNFTKNTISIHHYSASWLDPYIFDRLKLSSRILKFITPIFGNKIGKKVAYKTSVLVFFVLVKIKLIRRNNNG